MNFIYVYPILLYKYIVTMTDFFKKAATNASNLEESLLGPNYKYYENIYTPSEIGMSSSGSLDALTKNIAGLIGYVQVLSSGGGRASKTSGPLGNKFFLETGATCKDSKSGEDVTRSIYVNNIPDGSIPFISSGLGVNFTEFKGIIPGTLSNLAQINPVQIFGAFMSGPNPECSAIEMETVDVNNIKGTKTAYVTTNDISTMSPCWFNNKTNPVTQAKCREAFTSMSDAESMQQPTTTPPKTCHRKKKHARRMDYSAMPNDVFVKLYYSSLTLLVVYIFLKVFQKKA
jgi:hypothetical protein